jgi:hypothetical protein
MRLLSYEYLIGKHVKGKCDELFSTHCLIVCLEGITTRQAMYIQGCLARPGRKQATATEDFEFHISYL